MTKYRIKKIQFYFRPDMEKSIRWEKKLKKLIKNRFSYIHTLESNAFPRNKKQAPQLLIVLGGDGTILEAAQKFQKWNTLIFGMNLGHIGFLASVRHPKNFVFGLTRVLKGNYNFNSRMLIRASVVRRNKIVFSGYALNEITIQNLFGMVSLRVNIEDHPVQRIYGNGILIATATGSTAYNLSAHGPIVMPDIKCFIITELLDHNIPTPSLVIKRNRNISIIVEDFRENNHFIMKKTGKTADVILAADSERIVALDKGDKIIIRRSKKLVRFVELDKNYFFKSLQEKFEFK